MSHLPLPGVARVLAARFLGTIHRRSFRHVYTRSYVVRERCICAIESRVGEEVERYDRDWPVAEENNFIHAAEFSPGWFLNPFPCARARSLAYARSSIADRNLSISPFASTKLCQRMIVFRAARYRRLNTNSRDFSDKGIELPLTIWLTEKREKGRERERERERAIDFENSLIDDSLNLR
jgi:hypothetical protein